MYLYGGFTPSQEARGVVALLNKNGKQIDKETYNHWDEIPQKMRRLLNRNKKDDDFFTRTCWVGKTAVKDI